MLAEMAETADEIDVSARPRGASTVPIARRPEVAAARDRALARLRAAGETV